MPCRATSISGLYHHWLNGCHGIGCIWELLLRQFQRPSVLNYYCNSFLRFVFCISEILFVCCTYIFFLLSDQSWNLEDFKHKAGLHTSAEKINQVQSHHTLRSRSPCCSTEITALPLLSSYTRAQAASIKLAKNMNINHKAIILQLNLRATTT